MTHEQFRRYLVGMFEKIEETYNNELDKEEIANCGNDKIFLLSVEEYEKFKNIIPVNKCNWWWLRSPGDSPSYAAFVYNDGSVAYYGDCVSCDCNYVRPAIDISNLITEPGQRFIKYDHPWIALDTQIAIAEVPIAIHRFDKRSNDYEHSEIRTFLNQWIKERE